MFVILSSGEKENSTMVLARGMSKIPGRIDITGNLLDLEAGLLEPRGHVVDRPRPLDMFLVEPGPGMVGIAHECSHHERRGIQRGVEPGAVGDVEIILIASQHQSLLPGPFQTGAGVHVECECALGFESLENGAKEPLKLKLVFEVVDRIVNAGRQVKLFGNVQAGHIAFDEFDVERFRRSVLAGLCQHVWGTVESGGAQSGPGKGEGRGAGATTEIKNRRWVQTVLRELLENNSRDPFTE